MVGLTKKTHCPLAMCFLMVLNAQFLNYQTFVILLLDNYR